MRVERDESNEIKIRNMNSKRSVRMTREAKTRDSIRIWEKERATKEHRADILYLAVDNQSAGSYLDPAIPFLPAFPRTTMLIVARLTISLQRSHAN